MGNIAMDSLQKYQLFLLGLGYLSSWNDFCYPAKEVFLFFWLRPVAHEILGPRPGIEPRPRQ